MSGAAILCGFRVVVTRNMERSGVLTGRLEGLGATVVELPVIAMADPVDGGAALHAALANLPAYRWLVFTSANAASRVLDRVVAGGPVSAELPPIAVVGPATAASVEVRGFSVALMPRAHLAEGLVEAFPPGPGRVLFPQAAEGRDIVVTGLTAKGFAVDAVECYRTVRAASPSTELAAAAGRADAIAFTSSSTVTHYLGLVGPSGLPACVVCIGPATAATARAAGIHVTAVADPHTIDGLVGAVVESLVEGGSTPIVQR